MFLGLSLYQDAPYNKVMLERGYFTKLSSSTYDLFYLFNLLCVQFIKSEFDEQEKHV